MSDNDSESDNESESSNESDIDYSYFLEQLMENDEEFDETKNIAFSQLQKIKRVLEDSVNYYSTLDNSEKTTKDKLAPADAKSYVIVLVVENNDEFLIISDIMTMTPLYKFFFRNIGCGFMLGRKSWGSGNTNFKIRNDGIFDVTTFKYKDIKTFWRIR